MEEDPTLVSAFNQQLVKDESAGLDNVLRLWERGPGTPGYIVVGKWATTIANQYVKSTTVLKSWASGKTGGGGGGSIPAVPINEATARAAIQDALLQIGVPLVQMWSNSGGRWSCIKSGTPGNPGDFESILFEGDGADVQLTALGSIFIQEDATVGGVRIGASFINPVLRTLSVVQFHDNHQLTHLDALITQFTLKELVVANNLEAQLPNTFQSMNRVLQQVRGVSFRQVPSKDFTSATKDTLQQSLSIILRSAETSLDVLNKNDAVAATSALLKHWSGVNDEQNRSAFSLKTITTSSYLQLDAAAVQALNIVSIGQPEAPAGALPNSIYGFLNRCKTGMGSRLMRQWLLQPLRAIADIEDRYNMVEVMKESAVLRDSLNSSVLRSCTDMDRLNKKIQKGSATLQDAMTLLTFVHVVPNINQVLGSYSGRHTAFLRDEYISPLKDITDHMGNLNLLIDSSVEVSERHTRIKPSFDDALIELDAQRNGLLTAAEKEFGATMRKYKWSDKQLKMEIHSSYGHVFRVSRKDDKAVRDHPKDFITINTSKDGVRFATSELSRIAAEFKAVEKEYESRQKDLKEKLMETIATYLPILDDAKEIVAQLDVFVAWGTVAAESRCGMVRPTLEESSTNNLHIGELRHPLVEVRQSDFVANDVKFGSERNAMIITGPNMGGKSTYMRSVGVALVMAQAGCFVPAEIATISIRDAILCRVGATDYLSRGVSTFMVEMLEASSILATTTAASFVIIDELGRGTSTFDGFGLAWAIAEKVACEQKALLTFATHYHELTRLADQYKNVQNYHVTADASEETIRFLFKLEAGTCGRSFGVHVAKIAGLPESVVADARARAAELEGFGDAGASRALALTPEQAELLKAAALKVSKATTEEERAALRIELRANEELLKLLPPAAAAAN